MAALIADEEELLGELEDLDVGEGDAELDDELIDEWAEIADVDPVISGSTGMGEHTDHTTEDESPTSTFPPVDTSALSVAAGPAQGAKATLQPPVNKQDAQDLGPAVASSPLLAPTVTATQSRVPAPAPAAVGVGDAGSPAASLNAAPPVSPVAAILLDAAHASRKPPPMKSMFAAPPAPDNKAVPPTAAAAAVAVSTETAASPAAPQATPPGAEAIEAPAVQQVEHSAASKQTIEGEEEYLDKEEVAGPLPGGSVWGGWGGGWGALGSLTQAMGAAVKDVTELGTSFGQVLTDIAKEPSDDEPEEPPPAGSRAPPSQPVELVGPPSDSASSRTGPVSVLDRLGAPTEVEKTFQALDEGVDDLTGRAFGAFGGLLSKVGAVATAAAQELKETVQDGVKDIANLEVVKAASKGLGAAPKTAGGLMQSLGHGMLYLEDQFSNTLRGDGDAIASDSEPLSFQDCFMMHGGAQCMEELEHLVNECARSVNKARALFAQQGATVGTRAPDTAAQQRQEGIDPESKADRPQHALDDMLLQLSSMFDLQHPQHGSLESAPSTGLSRGHAIINELCQEGISRAQELGRMGKMKGVEMCSQLEALKSSEQGSAAAADEACLFLVGIQREATGKVAEACALCIERLLALAKSLSVQFRFGAPANDSIVWPEGAPGKAQALRQQVEHMQRDVDQLGAAFKDALSGSLSALMAAFNTAQVSDLDTVQAEVSGAAATMVESITADVGASTDRLCDAFRGMVYVVLLTTLDRTLLHSHA